MTREVLLSIRGLQFAEEATTDEEQEQIETICPAEYFYRNGAHYLLYEEMSVDMPDDGEETVRNMIKFRPQEFCITKKGPVNVQMVFEEGKKTMTNYVTPFGNILLALDTQHIVIQEESEDQIQVHIAYALEANYQYIADCHIEITITAQSKKDCS